MISVHSLFLLMFVLSQIPDVMQDQLTTRVCFSVTRKFRAKHVSCYLRPDTGPCRADILQFYYDMQKDRCYKFFWGGCQGNGNRFSTQEECSTYCKLAANESTDHIPHFCRLPFDYGTCFGHYYRYYYDNTYKVCKRRIYSGCGGNQNNFETITECRANCVTLPNNTLSTAAQYTRCESIDVVEERRRRRRK